MTSLAIGEGEIASAELVKNSRVVFSESPGSPRREMHWRDLDIDATAGGGGDYYYVRVQQSDGHRAWSSPIFLEIH